MITHYPNISEATAEPITTPSPKSVSRTLLICEYINSLDNMSPRQFIATFLSSNHEGLVYRRRLMRAGLGTKQTRSIFKNLGRLTKSCASGEEEWHRLILDEASAIVNAQEVARGHFPNGAYVSSNKITPDYFSESAGDHREKQVQAGMKFLHTLIHRKIALGMKKIDKVKYDDDETSLAPPLSADEGTPSREVDDGSGNIVGALDDEKLLSLENLVEVKQTSAAQEAHRLAVIPTMVCSMVAMACNRRINAMPLANGLITMAAGVTCRTNEWLHVLGLTTSRWTVLKSMDRLRVLQEYRMIELFKVNHKLLPLLCYDNIDIHLRIHNTRIETSSRLFHGTWGFFKVIEACLMATCTEEAVSLASFLNSMALAQHKKVLMGSFLHEPAQNKHWRLVIKSQLAKALKDYSTHIPGMPEPQMLPPLDTKPPAIDPIAMHKPNIHFLRMMDAPDSSADGISRVLDAIKLQLDVETGTFAENLLVAGGDVGSNLLLESLRVKRFPPFDGVEGLEWILSVFGGAHTTWNMAKSLWTLHWGKSDIADDSGVWRSSFSLGGDYKKPPACQDFNSTMRSLQMVHHANLVFVLKQVIQTMVGLDLTKAADCNKALDAVWNGYFDSTAVDLARESVDHTHFNLMLRLRDFATIVEAQNATRAGDVGRLMEMWKMWAIMAQGIPGLSHYAKHIPRLVLLLEEDLPRDLAHAIKHSLLIPSNEREGHWMAIDEYMEGHGTDIERLTYRLSNNIALLRRLMQLLKVLAGHKIIYQLNLQTITPASMKLFLRYADECLVPDSPATPPAQLADTWRLGHRNMLKLIRADKEAGQSSRFRWGSANVMTSSCEGDEDIHLEGS